MRVTFGSIKERLARVLNMSSTDTRILSYCGDACQRLIYSGKWVDTQVRYAVCVNEACLTWPRDVETIEAAAICSCPINIRNGWYEFLDGGPGIVTEEDGWIGRNLVDKENAVAFDDVVGTGKKIAVYADGSEAVGSQILLRYWNSTGNKVYTGSGSGREEGEYISLPAAGGYTYSTYEVLPYGLYGVIKPVTNRVIRLYEYTVAGGALKPLAYYEPDETIPVYRRSLIPFLKRGGCSDSAGGSEGGCDTTTVTIRGKLRYIPPVNDNSILQIPHATAIRLACQALKKEEDNLITEAEMYWQKAYEALNMQLHHWQGDGALQPIRVETISCPVHSLI
jgi:hypothetical protein